MSQSANQRGHNPNDQQSSNNGNIVDPTYYGDFSSMSALASAAGVQEHQSHQSYHEQGLSNSAGFPELDSHLNLYGDLDSHTSNNAYTDFAPHNGLDGHNMGTGYVPANTAMNEWYAPPIGNGLSTFIDNYQNFPQQQQTHIVPQTQSPIKASQSIPKPQVAFRKVPTPNKQEASQNSLAQDGDQENEDEPMQDEQTTPDELDSSKESSLVPERALDHGSLDPVHKAPPAPPAPPMAPEAKYHLDSSSFRTRVDFRPRTSMPFDMQPREYAQQCMLAAYASRLNPFALHPAEHKLLRNHINHVQITIYLNIRNGILRLWTSNPLVSVTKEEAAGCSKDYRWFDLADVAYYWLLRNGYINFGCVEVPRAISLLTIADGQNPGLVPKQKTIVVIGAGMAGLGCARQLEGLFLQLGDAWTAKGRQIPKVIVLEAKKRIGGRVYSHPLAVQEKSSLPDGLRSTAEMGAQIITGFDHGNPLSIIIRGQLALRCHPLKDNSILYDVDGTLVDKANDVLVEKLYNDILDRASAYRNKITAPKAVEGDKEIIASGKEPTGEGGRPISVMENAAAHIPIVGSTFELSRNGSIYPVHNSIDKLTGKANMTTGSSQKEPAAKVAANMGWQLGTEISPDQTLELDGITHGTSHPTLGAAMDEAVRQYQSIVNITPQDMRLLNWHFANLEYANAANVADLSLGGWDLDIGNEFEGEHAEVIGGYLQVPRGIWKAPTELDVRIGKPVKKIKYNVSGRPDFTTQIECEDGETIEADKVVLTAPLGVLKSQAIEFEPSLPQWKTGAIERLGFGTLNKIVLVYETAFWDEDRDMFGLLRESEKADSLEQKDYVANRGRFYLFWNCIKTSGRPMLVALMAGEAAHQVESTSDKELIQDVTKTLGKMFSNKNVPRPSEAIITRWGRDPHTRGSYSYVAPAAQVDDYDQMAKPVGNLFFAGEATCGTHPATVHGAYLSGLRAASEVLESLLGPITVPRPLIRPKAAVEDVAAVSATGQKRKSSSGAARLQELRDQRTEAYENALQNHISARLGERPTKPGRAGANPFLLYQKDHWHTCKIKCDALRQLDSKNDGAKASRNEVRTALGLMWREASDEVKRPYLEATKDNRDRNEADAKEFEKRLVEWDQESERMAITYRENHPNKPSAEEERLRLESEGSNESAKRGRIEKLV